MMPVEFYSSLYAAYRYLCVMARIFNVFGIFASISEIPDLNATLSPIITIYLQLEERHVFSSHYFLFNPFSHAIHSQKYDCFAINLFITIINNYIKPKSVNITFLKLKCICLTENAKK